jgi:hypothetical protein
MFNWFNNLKMGIKFTVAFLAIMVIMGSVVGFFNLFNLQNMKTVVAHISGQRIPTVHNATTVERYALRTILTEKLYILAADDARMDPAQIQGTAMDNIEQILKALDEVEKVARTYNDQDIIDKIQKTRTVTQQYKDLFNQGALL